MRVTSSGVDQNGSAPSCQEPVSTKSWTSHPFSSTQTGRSDSQPTETATIPTRTRRRRGNGGEGYSSAGGAVETSVPCMNE